MTSRPRKSDIDAIIACLDAGLELESVYQGQVVRYTAGQVTRQVEGKWLRTTHLMPSGSSYVWISADTVARLAGQARAKLARKDEILAEQDRVHAVMMGRD